MNAECLPLRLGISQCLLGEPVRYDGGHKRDRFLVDVLGQHIEWVPICPEVEAGLGTPREPMHLINDLESPRLVTIRSNQDHTQQISRNTKKRLRDLRSLNLMGYVFKKDSPSCGIRQVKVLTREGRRLGTGQGLFAKGFQRTFPLIPIEDEGQLQDQAWRENFIERVFGYYRWQSLHHGRVTRNAVIQFHHAQKYLLLAHSRRHYHMLSQLISKTTQYTPKQLADAYGPLVMQAFSVKTSVRKHLNVLQQLATHLKSPLSPKAFSDLQGVLHDYHQGLVPLSVPITLIRHYVQVLEVHALMDQVYLSSHPKELMLRNHV